MNQNELHDFIAAIEEGPVRLERAIESAITSEIAGIPAEIGEEIAGRVRQEFAARVAELVENSEYRHLNSLASAIRSRCGDLVSFERTSHDGKLHTILPADEIKRVAGRGMFERLKWNREGSAFAHNLQVGERIVDGECDFRKLVILQKDGSRRTLLRRGDWLDAMRPSGYSREFWLDNQCTPEHTIAEAENQARHLSAELARPFSDFSGPDTTRGGARR